MNKDNFKEIKYKIKKDRKKKKEKEGERLGNIFLRVD